MIKIQKADDLISISIENVLKHRMKDYSAQVLAKDWNKTIVINIEHFYAISVIFKGEVISFKIGVIPKSDLHISMSLHNMLDMATGRLNLIVAFLTRKLKIKEIYKIGTLLKFYKIFFIGMKMTMAEPNTNYFEVYKEVR